MELVKAAPAAEAVLKTITAEMMAKISQPRNLRTRFLLFWISSWKNRANCDSLSYPFQVQVRFTGTQIFSLLLNGRRTEKLFTSSLVTYDLKTKRISRQKIQAIPVIN